MNSYLKSVLIVFGVVVLLILGFLPRLLEGRRHFDQQLALQAAHEQEQNKLTLDQELTLFLGYEVMVTDTQSSFLTPSHLMEDVRYAMTKFRGYTPPGKGNSCLKELIHLADPEVPIYFSDNPQYTEGVKAHAFACRTIQPRLGEDAFFVKEAIVLPKRRHSPSILATILMHEFVHICQFRETRRQYGGCEQWRDSKMSQQAYVWSELEATEAQLNFFEFLVRNRAWEMKPFPQENWGQEPIYPIEISYMVGWKRLSKKWWDGELPNHFKKQYVSRVQK